MKTKDLQKIFFTTIATDINVTVHSLYLFVPILIPNTETQVRLLEIIIQSHMIRGIQNANYQSMVINFKSSLVAKIGSLITIMLIVLNI